MSSYTNIFYIGMYLLLTSSIATFLPISAGQYHKTILTYSETDAKSIFERFWHCHFWKVQFQLSSIFLIFSM